MEAPESNFKETLDLIRKAEKEGKIVLMTEMGLMGVSMEKFCQQDADNILYDLNRDEATTLTLGNEGLVRWVNDYAVAKVIRYLKENQK
jgi:predicted amidohydrolase